MKYNLFIISIFFSIFLVSCTPDTQELSQNTQEEEMSEQIEINSEIIETPEEIIPEEPLVKLAPSDVIVSEWISGLDIPWELAFISEDTALVTQR
jgi:hypothetical protein